MLVHVLLACFGAFSERRCWHTAVILFSHSSSCTYLSVALHNLDCNPDPNFSLWLFERKLGTLVTPVLGNVHTNFGCPAFILFFKFEACTGQTDRQDPWCGLLWRSFVVRSFLACTTMNALGFAIMTAA